MRFRCACVLVCFGNSCRKIFMCALPSVIKTCTRNRALSPLYLTPDAPFLPWSRVTAEYGVQHSTVRLQYSVGEIKFVFAFRIKYRWKKSGSSFWWYKSTVIGINRQWVFFFWFFLSFFVLTSLYLFIVGVSRDHTQRHTHTHTHTHTLRHTTLCRTPLHEQSARRRDLYLTTHNTHKRQTSMFRRDSNPRSQQASSRRPTH
jgi:hypothetical protein